MRRPLAAFFVVSLLAACGSSSPTVAPTPTPVAFTLQTVVFSFAADVAAMTTAGATAQVIALGVSPTGATRDVTSTCTNWRSDDPSVLSVTSGGLLTAQRTSGSATITTTCQGIAASGLVMVNPPPSLAPGPAPGPTSCTSPPYHWDANPDVLRCREVTTGRFAASACCGR